jgi:two-component system NtrC family sensor kinase
LLVKILRGSLVGKFTARTSFVILVTIAIFAYVTIETQSEVFLKEAQDDVETLSEIILHTAHMQMQQGNLDIVYRMMDDASTHEKIARIRLFDEQGTIRYSTHRNEIGHGVKQSGNECLSCHCPAITETFPSMTASRRVIKDCRGDEFLSVTTLISNQPDCSTASCHIHPPELPVLGVLEVQASLHNVVVQANTYRKNVLAFAASLLLIIVVCLFWLTQDLVVRPVHGLMMHITEVASLQFESQIETLSNDEMGELAHAFNLLTAQLRKVQCEYNQLTETLEARILQRTDEIAQMHTQLLHAEKLASLGELVAGIAHEINNPLAGILIFSTLLANDQALPPRLRSDAQTILGETRRCAAIVRRLLEFSRNSIPHKELTSLSAIMENTLTLVEHQANLGEVEIIRRYDQSLPEILVDPGQIEQVFVNMIVNACQAMPDGGRLTITLQADYQDNCVRAGIADTGYGISGEHLRKIFDPFFTTKEPSANGLAGTGLGLSVSYGIIENHGGRISVASEINSGTTFTVELPLPSPEPFAGDGLLPTVSSVG